MSEAPMSVEVVFAQPGRQILRRVSLPAGSTVSDAVRASGLLGEFPEIDPTRLGIYGKPVASSVRLHDGDRVEIYRPLKADPKELRLARARRRNATK
jgi:putative ubiquitin-RnfH superfamily antitoxin RatB of RatAB toxin-antitoxin module